MGGAEKQNWSTQNICDLAIQSISFPIMTGTNLCHRMHHSLEALNRQT